MSNSENDDKSSERIKADQLQFEHWQTVCWMVGYELGREFRAVDLHTATWLNAEGKRLTAHRGSRREGAFTISDGPERWEIYWDTDELVASGVFRVPADRTLACPLCHSYIVARDGEAPSRVAQMPYPVTADCSRPVCRYHPKSGTRRWFAHLHCFQRWARDNAPNQRGAA